MKRTTNNPDKVIKDLRDRNDKLELQRREFECRLYSEQLLTNRLKEQIKQLEKENEHKDKIIKELRALKEKY